MPNVAQLRSLPYKKDPKGQIIYPSLPAIPIPLIQNTINKEGQDNHDKYLLGKKGKHMRVVSLEWFWNLARQTSGSLLLWLRGNDVLSEPSVSVHCSHDPRVHPYSCISAPRWSRSVQWPLFQEEDIQGQGWAETERGCWLASVTHPPEPLGFIFLIHLVLFWEFITV